MHPPTDEGKDNDVGTGCGAPAGLDGADTTTAAPVVCPGLANLLGLGREQGADVVSHGNACGLRSPIEGPE